jgi:hypothetical protein
MPKRKKPSEFKQLLETKHKRLATMRNKAKADKILQTEKKWEKLVWDRRADELLQYEPVKNLIKGAASGWGRMYKRYRLSSHDFESVFYLAAWTVISNYTWETEFFLYEMIRQAIKSQGLNMLRDCFASCRGALHKALSLEEFYFDESAPTMADVVVDKLFEEQYLLDPRLTESERRILWSVCDKENTKVSQRKVARDSGIDRRVVPRIMNQLRRKLEPYRTA